ncbi:MAG: hypothetical protein KF855_03825 [Acidobacteria bacterium]|nr:hypothetical protein [Acidobacteriota bacterium]
MRSTVSSHMEYAPALDNGAKAPSTRSRRRSSRFVGPMERLMGPHRGGMAARPFFKTTAEAFRPKFKKNIQDAIAKLTK